MANKKNVCFFFPDRKLGGGPYYLLRLAIELAKDKRYNVFYIDFSDGFSHQIPMDTSGIRFIDYESFSGKIYFEEECVLFAQIHYLFDMPIVNPKSKVLFFNWHNCCIPELKKRMWFTDAEMHSFLDLVNKNQAQVFCDYFHRKANNEISKIDFAKHYVPVSVDPKKRRAPSALVSKDTINIAVLGRLVSDKIYGVLNLIKQAQKSKIKQSIVFHIIGEGQYIDLLPKKTPKNIQIKKCGAIVDDELNEYLTNNVDILFAMGTSVLEGGALGLPSVILPYEMKNFDSDTFIYLYDALDYSLGCEVSQVNKEQFRTFTFKNIIEDIYVKRLKKEIGSKCLKYVQHNHYIASNTQLLKKYLDTTTLLFEDVHNFYRKQCAICKTRPNPNLPVKNKVRFNKIKYYIALFGIKIIKIVKTDVNKYDFYLFGLALLSIKRKQNVFKLNMPLFKQISVSVKKNSKKLVETLSKIFVCLRNKIEKQLICRKFRQGKPLTICLFQARPGMRCFDYLYKILQNDPRFIVKYVIMPDPNFGKESLIRNVREVYEELLSHGYPNDMIIKGYDAYTDSFVDLQQLNPDILFYTDFWKPHFLPNFYIDRFRNKITLLTEYGFATMHDESVCTFDLNNQVDIYFRYSPKLLESAQKLMKNKAKNVVLTGSPKLDVRFDESYIAKSPWKTDKLKKIIWAPHHSSENPDSMYRYNAFYEISEFMLSVAEKYKDKVQFIFRPHPLLIEKLKMHWGIAKQEKYYERWENLTGLPVSKGDFTDLFMTSDAMIMDCCAFLAEYTAFNKPLLFTTTKTSRVVLNDFGKEIFPCVYKTTNNLQDDIIQFIEQVVLSGNDYLKETRQQIVDAYFSKIDGKTASEDIYNKIVKYLEEH